MIAATQKPWRERCRCGAPMEFAMEDIATHTPAAGTDTWCADGSSHTGPHDSGVVVFGPSRRLVAVVVSQ